MLRAPYLQALSAVGGTPPYRWSAESIRRLPRGLFEDASESTLEAFGLALDPSGAVLRGVPTAVGTLKFLLEVSDAEGAMDSAEFTLAIGSPSGLSLSTTALPDAFIGNPYSVALSVAGVDAEDLKAVRFSLPCLTEDVGEGQGACTAGSPSAGLPRGLSLSELGLLEGTASGDPGVHSFLVEVRDAWGRMDVKPLAVRVRAPVTQVANGCTGAGAPPASWLFVFALSAPLWRPLATRRRASRGEHS